MRRIVKRTTPIRTLLDRSQWPMPSSVMRYRQQGLPCTVPVMCSSHQKFGIRSIGLLPELTMTLRWCDIILRTGEGFEVLCLSPLSVDGNMYLATAH